MGDSSLAERGLAYPALAMASLLLLTACSGTTTGTSARHAGLGPSCRPPASASSTPLGTWQAVAPLPEPLISMPGAATGCDGRIYVFGGFGPSGRPATAVVAYSPDTDAWTSVTTEPDPGRGTPAVARGLDGRIYVFGETGDGRMDVYTPGTNTWSRVAPLPNGRLNACATTGLDGRIYVIGGLLNPATSSVIEEGTHGLEVYSPSTDSWSVGARMPTGRYELGCATAPDGRIYAIGGFGENGAVRTVEVYDPSRRTWSAAPPLPFPRLNVGVATGPNGDLYVLGGGTLDVLETNTVQIFPAATGQWHQGPPLQAVGGHIAAATGGDGRIYAVGVGKAADPDHTAVEAFATLPPTRPAPTPTATPAAAPTDWRNTRYTLTCAGDASAPFAVAVRNGMGQTTLGATTYVVNVAAVATGDLTGAGTPDTAVMLYCSPQPSNFTETEVEVLDAGGQKLAELEAPSQPGPPPLLRPVFDPGGFAIRGGQLVTTVKRYGPNDSHASGPSIQQTVTWRWNGHDFVPSSS